jgi:predicted nucleotidyltransferase
MSQVIHCYGVPLSKDKVAAFCRRWKIDEFALFGSVLRDDFRPDSDIDVLVTRLLQPHHASRDRQQASDLVECLQRKP